MPNSSIRQVSIIGAGTMGSGIAAHLANMGFQVSLLDETAGIAAAGLDRVRQSQPPSFYVPERAAEIRTGSVQENLGWISEADWVCEAIVERSDIKKALFEQIGGAIKSDAIVSTNTSALPIGMLAEDLPADLKRRFLGVHFFNPPRYLRLIELIPTANTDLSVVYDMSTFLEDEAARRVIVAKDSPGFIANRYGMWCMFHATRVAEHLRLPVEDVDAITGQFLGRPKSGTFRLNDMVGLDVMRDVALNLLERCSNDPDIVTLETTNSMFSLLARGWLGEKSGQGYYRREGKELLTLELDTLAYRMHREPTLPDLAELGKLPLGERLQRALELKSEVGEYLREYLIPALRYANKIKEEICQSVSDFDRVMTWGFGWEMGPFALIDAIGPERLGLPIKDSFYRNGSFLTFSGGYEKVQENEAFRSLSSYREISRSGSFVLRDLGDGVTAVGLSTKMGVITPEAVGELTHLLESRLDRFILTSENRSFSAGYDLNFFYAAITEERWDDIERELKALQHLGELIEQKSCVAAVFGHCLGAGLELALSCPRILAAAETHIGFPESRVGLLPAGRGVTLMRLFNAYTAKRLAEVAVTVTEGTIALNADSARQMGFLRSDDCTVYNPDRLISAAKAALLTLAPPVRQPWVSTVGPVIGIIDRSIAELRSSGALTEHDELIGGKIRQIIARSTSYEDALERERTEFIDLCTKSMTQSRIRHMLETKRPLRN